MSSLLVRQGRVLHLRAIVAARFDSVGVGSSRVNYPVFCRSDWPTAELAAIKTLMFFQKSAPMDILTIRDIAEGQRILPTNYCRSKDAVVCRDASSHRPCETDDA